MEILSSGIGEFRFAGLDVIRARRRDRDHKRGDAALVRGNIRQGGRNLSRRPKFTLVESTLQRMAGAVSTIDVDFTDRGDAPSRAER